MKEGFVSFVARKKSGQPSFDEYQTMDHAVRIQARQEFVKDFADEVGKLVPEANIDFLNWLSGAVYFSLPENQAEENASKIAEYIKCEVRKESPAPVKVIE